MPSDGKCLSLNGTLGRSGLRSRGTTPIRCAQATSNRDLDVEDHRLIPVEPLRWSGLRGEAPETRFTPSRRAVVVTWGPTPVGRSITIMDRVLRCSRGIDPDATPPPRWGETTRAGTPRCTGLSRALARGRPRHPSSEGRRWNRVDAVRKPASCCNREQSRLRVSLDPFRAEGASTEGDRVIPVSRTEPLRRLRKWSRNQGGSGRAGLTRGTTTSVRIPAVGSCQAIVPRCGPMEAHRLGGGAPGGRAGRSRQGVERVWTTRGQRPR